MRNHPFVLPACGLLFSFSAGLALSACGSPAAATGAPQIGSDLSTGLLGAPATADPEAQRLLELINGFRAARGLAALRFDPKLQASAQWLAQDMVDRNQMSHTDSLGRGPFARIRAFGYVDGGRAAENVAAGYESARRIFEMWRDSPPHRQNMLGSTYRYAGIGRAYGASTEYRWYWALPVSE